MIAFTIVGNDTVYYCKSIITAHSFCNKINLTIWQDWNVEISKNELKKTEFRGIYLRKSEQERIVGTKTTILGLESILEMDISGKYDLHRDLMCSEDEGAFDDGTWNYIFKFLTNEISWDSPIEIIDAYEI